MLNILKYSKPIIFAENTKLNLSIKSFEILPTSLTHFLLVN